MSIDKSINKDLAAINQWLVKIGEIFNFKAGII